MAGVPSVPIRSPAAPVVPVQGSPVPVPSASYQSPNVAPAQVYQPGLQRRPSFAPPTPGVPYPGAAVSSPYAAAQATPYSPYQTNRLVPQPTVYNPNAPRPIEVFQLSDAANAAIPADIREQFHCDDHSRVLFFSSLPMDILPSSRQKLGHSLKYLAVKEERRKKVEERKRKASEQEEREKVAKRARADEESALATRVEALTNRAVETMTNQIVSETDKIYEALYQDQADAAKSADAKVREQRVVIDRATQEQTAGIKAHSQGTSFVSLRGNAVYMDDIEPRS